MAFYHKYGTGELLSRLTNDIAAYRDVLGPGIMYPLFVLTIATPGLAALFIISKPLASVALLPLLIIPFVNEVARKKIYILSSLVQKTLGKISSMVQEHFSAIRIIKSYVIENAMWHRFCQISKAFSATSLRLSFWQ